MACPHVSGVAALVIKKHGVGKQGFTAEQLKEILLSTAFNIDSYNPRYIGMLGSGCVDAAAALQAKLPEIRPEEPDTPNTSIVENFILQTNPVTDGLLKFRVNARLIGNATITIYNSIGNKVFIKNEKTRQYITISIDISKLSAGYYTLQYDCNGFTIKKKFIKY